MFNFDRLLQIFIAACGAGALYFVWVDHIAKSGPEIPGNGASMTPWWAYIVIAICAASFISQLVRWAINHRTAQTDFSRPLKLILNQKFTSAHIELDGFNYTNCHFDDCRFSYDGSAGTAFTNCKIEKGQKIILSTSNPSCQQLMEVMNGLMAISDGRLPEFGRNIVPKKD